MSMILLWQVRLEERQKLLRGASTVFRRPSGSSNAASCARTCQCRLGRLVLGQICGEVRGQRWGSWFWECMKYFYGADVGVCGLKAKQEAMERV